MVLLMRRSMLLLAALALILSGMAPAALAASCRHRDLPPGGLDRCVVQNVAEADEPFVWLPGAAGSLVLGAAIAAFFLVRGRSRGWVPRSEDEAWAELLGPQEVTKS
jgi:hypothetical protein